MIDDLKWLAGLAVIPVTWLVRLVWLNHTDLQSIKDKHPTWEHMHFHIRQCSDEKDKAINDLKEDTRYIRGKVDKLYDIQIRKGDK